MPKQVGVGTSWAAITTGDHHTCALTTNDRLFCWGANGNGQVGDGTTSSRHTQTEIPVPPSASWKAVSAGDHHTCARASDASLFCWGSNSDGQVGDGTTTQRTSPVKVGVGHTWAAVSAGSIHTCARRDTTNTLFCWGDNTRGEVGDGTTIDRHGPTQEKGLGPWTLGVAGYHHTCGLKSDGTLYCWGCNGYGEIGTGRGANAHVPTQVGTDTNWIDVSPGYLMSCGIKGAGELWCWGINYWGQLGTGVAWMLVPTILSF